MAKVIKLNKSETIEQLKSKLKTFQENIKGLNAQKYSGSIKIEEDPVKYQKRLRDEWN